jgi:hypothetical protein
MRVYALAIRFQLGFFIFSFFFSLLCFNVIVISLPSTYSVLLYLFSFRFSSSHLQFETSQTEKSRAGDFTEQSETEAAKPESEAKRGGGSDGTATTERRARKPGLTRKKSMSLHSHLHSHSHCVRLHYGFRFSVFLVLVLLLFDCFLFVAVIFARA